MDCMRKVRDDRTTCVRSVMSGRMRKVHDDWTACVAGGLPLIRDDPSAPLPDTGRLSGWATPY